MTRTLPFLLLALASFPTSAFAQTMSANPTSASVYLNVPAYIGCHAYWQSNQDYNRSQVLSNLPAEDGGVIELTCWYNTGMMAFRVQGQVQAVGPFPWKSTITVTDSQTNTHYKWRDVPVAGELTLDTPVTLDGSPSGDGGFMHLYYWQAPVAATQQPGLYLLAAVFTVTSI